MIKPKIQFRTANLGLAAGLTIWMSGQDARIEERYFASLRTT
jgi:hypothetical protein